MKRSICLASLVLVIALAGCATLVTDTSQSISISCNIDGASLYLDGQSIGTTPFTGVVPKNKKQLKIEKDGYRTETVVLSKSLEVMFWGNIIIGGTVGSITDFATGAAYAYAPATYQVELQENSQTLLEFQQQYAVRKFSMIFIDEISKDLALSSGEYLSSLCELIGNESAQSSLTECVRSALRSSGGDPVVFGKLVVDLI